MDLYTLIAWFITVYGKIFAILNPFSAIPIFINLTENASSEERKRVIKKAFLAMVIMVMVFTLIGIWVLEFLGISIASLRIAGGAVLFVLAMDMLGDMPRTKRLEETEIAVIPIATPLLVGPGTLTTIIVLTAENPSLQGYTLILLASLAAVATAAIILRYSLLLAKVLSKSFIKALARFMSLIIAATAVELIRMGVNEWIAELTK
ncbi:MAG: MarC family protein [Sulfolobales archaeon]|nr:MarC family protein [Sulfolobales archaeon]MCX8199683.1 MarC family protein [Sulfolobales archaeon]MDW8170637.1 MarC family protein [Desulfurococcaceae archaeon]